MWLWAATAGKHWLEGVTPQLTQWQTSRQRCKPPTSLVSRQRSGLHQKNNAAAPSPSLPAAWMCLTLQQPGQQQAPCQQPQAKPASLVLLWQLQAPPFWTWHPSPAIQQPPPQLPARPPLKPSQAPLQSRQPSASGAGPARCSLPRPCLQQVVTAVKAAPVAASPTQPPHRRRKRSNQPTLQLPPFKECTHRINFHSQSSSLSSLSNRHLLQVGLRLLLLAQSVASRSRGVPSLP
ncbi:hypothetical protein V8C86DRAFT_2752059 [Haematococcus lacustris]